MVYSITFIMIYRVVEQLGVGDLCVRCVAVVFYLGQEVLNFYALITLTVLHLVRREILRIILLMNMLIIRQIISSFIYIGKILINSNSNC